MSAKYEKLIRLEEAARMYYIDGKKQSEIAKHFNVSRPFVSRMLAEAKDEGIVDIKINVPEFDDAFFAEHLKRRYGLHDGIFVPDDNDKATNQALSLAAISLLDTLKTCNLGVGWGHLIGAMVSYMANESAQDKTVRTVCPMIGNAGIAVRHYQSTDTVLMFSKYLNAMPYFFNLPALPEDREERDVFCNTETYRQMLRQWSKIDTAFVNIGNHPSVPDFASGARFGSLLREKKACGRLIAYFFNREGEIIESEQDFVMQIPLELLKKCKNIVGLCSANTSLRALEGALSTGMFTHLVARKTLVKSLLFPER